MNEQLQILAEQAASEFTQNFSWEYLPEIDKDIFEKFAESIIQECISAAEDAQADFYVINNIKTRFGIKE